MMTMYTRDTAGLSYDRMNETKSKPDELAQTSFET
jgi:hypothetical protein